MSIDPLYTFTYSPFTIKNDTGLPCQTIPITDELINYVDFRGPQVIDFADLELIGNCSKMSYCDVKTKTCQPKLPLGSRCKYNMHCYFGIDGIPGHCSSNGTCTIREDIPQYYYNTPRWSMGDQWKPAVIAVLITGAIATALIVGRIQVKKLIHYLKSALERWQNSDSSSAPISYAVNEQVWNEHHDQQRRWWKQVPGVNWVYQKLNSRGEREQYYQLDNRNEEPPPYREG